MYLNIARKINALLIANKKAVAVASVLLGVFLWVSFGPIPGRYQYIHSDGIISGRVDNWTGKSWVVQQGLNGPEWVPISDPSSSMGIRRNASVESYRIPSRTNAELFDMAACGACHTLALVPGAVGVVGPSLDGIGSRRDVIWLKHFLKNPEALIPGTSMPNLGLTDDEASQLARFLSTR